jgi:hypothetical protein
MGVRRWWLCGRAWYLVVLGLALALVGGGGCLGRGGRGRDAEAAKRAAKARMSGGTKLSAERRERRLAGRSCCGRDEKVTKLKRKRNAKQNSNKKNYKTQVASTYRQG